MKNVKDFPGLKIAKEMELVVCLNLWENQKRIFLMKDILQELMISGKKFDLMLKISEHIRKLIFINFSSF